MSVRLLSSRKYPSLPSVGGDPVSHTKVLESVRDALQIHERRTADIKNSFVRVQDLIDLGFIRVTGNVATPTIVASSSGSAGGGGSGLVYSSTFIPAANTRANSTSELVFGSSYNVPGGTLVEGTLLRARVWGTYGTDATPPTLRIKVKLGTVTLLDSTAVTPTGSLVGAGWTLDVSVSVQNDTSASNLDAQGVLELSTATATGQLINLVNTGFKSLDASVDRTLTVTVQWGTADTDNTITLRQMAVWIESAPVEDESALPSDPDFANVKALLHFNGSNGSTTITDVLGHAFTANGSGTEISTAQSEAGGASVRMPDTSGAYVKSGAEADFGLGTLDYTIEMWLYFDASGGTQFIFDMRPFSAGGSGPIITGISAVWNIYLNGGFNISGGTITATTWTHIALTRASNTSRFFVNGTQVGSNFTDAHDYGSSQNIIFGRPSDSDSIRFKGYIDEFRLTRGLARYTANFTPPTPPFLDQ